jgi:hypothetical protein
VARRHGPAPALRRSIAAAARPGALIKSPDIEENVMRRTLIALLFAAAAPVFAQQQPPKLEPLPEPPPPPPGVAADEDLEPQVTIKQRGEEKVEEFRIHGRLYMIKVTPPHGVPYYLVDPKGNGQFVPATEVQPTLSVPMWVIKSW